MIFLEMFGIFLLLMVPIVGAVFLFISLSTLLNPLSKKRRADIADAIANASEAVQAIMGERNGEARMALLLKNTGLNALQHRDGMLLMRGGSAPLSALLDGKRVAGVLGSGVDAAWPARGMWVSESAWSALTEPSSEVHHPVAMLLAMREAASSMPYEGGTLAQALLSHDGPLRLPSPLANALFMPVSLLTSSEKESVKTVLSKRGADITEGDLAASVSIADLLDRAAVRQRAKQARDSNT